MKKLFIIAIFVLLNFQACRNNYNHAWVFTFKSEPSRIEIKNKKIFPLKTVTIIIKGVSLPNSFDKEITFDKKVINIPIGKIKFQDITCLPGRIIIQIDNHTIDCMERALIINGREILWTQAVKNKIILSLSDSSERVLEK